MENIVPLIVLAVIILAVLYHFNAVAHTKMDAMNAALHAKLDSLLNKTPPAPPAA